MISISGKKRWIWASALLALAIWKIASLIVRQPIILPSPDETLVYSLRLLFLSSTWLAILATLRRVLFSLLLNIVFAVIGGIAAGIWSPVYYLASPIVSVMKSVPTMGVILLSLIWFNSETATIFVCTLIVFPILYSAVVSGIRNLDPKLSGMHQVFRISFPKTLRHFYLPSIRPFLMSGLMAGLGLSMKVLIAAEVLSQPQKGIGTMFQIERARLNTVGVFAWSLVVILITSLLDFLLAAAKNKFGKNDDRR